MEGISFGFDLNWEIVLLVVLFVNFFLEVVRLVLELGVWLNFGYEGFVRVNEIKMDLEFFVVWFSLVV